MPLVGAADTPTDECNILIGWPAAYIGRGWFRCAFNARASEIERVGIGFWNQTAGPGLAMDWLWGDRPLGD